MDSSWPEKAWIWSGVIFALRMGTSRRNPGGYSSRTGPRVLHKVVITAQTRTVPMRNLSGITGTTHNVISRPCGKNNPGSG
jgi:hypothetical protein